MRRGAVGLDDEPLRPPQEVDLEALDRDVHRGAGQAVSTQTTRGRAASTPTICVHPSRSLDPVRDVVLAPDGLALTSVTRTLVYYARRASTKRHGMSSGPESWRRSPPAVGTV